MATASKPYFFQTYFDFGGNVWIFAPLLHIASCKTASPMLHRRVSIGACADEDSALKLIAEDSAANGATRKSTVRGIRASKTRQREPAGDARF
jgi:hypothetical protein